jgi:hypothetical protein
MGAKAAAGETPSDEQPLGERTRSGSQEKPSAWQVFLGDAQVRLLSRTYRACRSGGTFKQAWWGPGRGGTRPTLSNRLLTG